MIILITSYTEIYKNVLKMAKHCLFLRSSSFTMDKNTVFFSMNKFYKRKENLILIRTKFFLEWSKMKLNWDYTGVEYKLFKKFRINT